jgi:signal transduction histidine kinase
LGAGEHRFVAASGTLLAIALQGAWLNDELGRQVTSGERREQALSALNARLMQVQEEERRRLALELHDDPLQRAILLLRELNETTEPPVVDRWRREVDEIVTALRAICAGLRPRPLDDFGLPAGLEWLVDDLRARCNVAIYLVAEASDGTPFGRYPPDLEFALFRVAQEALSNCVKHAGASQVIVTLWREADALRLTVADDGRGFPADLGDNALGRHLGILGMRERLGPWGGHVAVEPGATGGTVVTAEIPIEKRKTKNEKVPGEEPVPEVKHRSSA